MFLISRHFLPDYSILIFTKSWWIFNEQVRGHLNSTTQKVVDISAAIGTDSSVTDIHKMCVSEELKLSGADEELTRDSRGSSVCTLPREAQTRLVLLEHGDYDCRPVSKVLLIPHTGTVVHCWLFIDKTIQYIINIRYAHNHCNSSIAFFR